MIVFLVRRLSWVALTLWLVFTLSFLLMRSVPGGPFDQERQVDPEIRRQQERRYHLDEPLWRQYVRELGNVLRLDLGQSYKMTDYSVGQVIRDGFPVSASLGVLAISWAFALGIPLGTIAAVKRGKLVDSFVMAVATAGIAIPSFAVAGIMLILFAFVVPLFPVARWGTITQCVLPAFCLGLPYAAYIARLVRTGMLDVLGQDYIRTARAKGVSETMILIRHALKSALLPVVSFLGPAVAGVLTGSLVIEQVFALPGLGVHFVQSALQRDYTLSMGLVLLYAALLSLMNLIVDVLYTVLDPRVEL